MVLVTRPFIGKIFDKKGHKVVIIPGAVCMGLGVLILSFANSIVTLVIASLFFGFGYGATQPSLLACTDCSDGGNLQAQGSPGRRR